MTPSAAAGECIYAVGDIHGCLEQMKKLVGMIAVDAAARPEPVKKLIFLGDYIDRGPDSKGVIDFLLHDLPADMQRVFLRGNHEDIMLRFIHGHRDCLSSWLRFGGVETLESYGIGLSRPQAEANPDALHQAMLQRVPPAHLDFLAATQFYHQAGDYYFAHAGVRPGVPLDRQDKDDLMWIRDAFLLSGADFGRIVVHGHTIAPKPEVRPNRIGIDTGCFMSGRLTCLVLAGEEKKFLAT